MCSSKTARVAVIGEGFVSIWAQETAVRWRDRHLFGLSGHTNQHIAHKYPVTHLMNGEIVNVRKYHVTLAEVSEHHCTYVSVRMTCTFASYLCVFRNKRGLYDWWHPDVSWWQMTEECSLFFSHLHTDTGSSSAHSLFHFPFEGRVGLPPFLSFLGLKETLCKNAF